MERKNNVGLKPFFNFYFKLTCPHFRQSKDLIIRDRNTYGCIYEVPKPINPPRLEWHDHVECCLQIYSPTNDMSCV